MTSNEEYIRKNRVIIVDDDKNTKLHYAASLNNLEEIDKIIASGQKLDPENYLGWTPLMMAIRNGNDKVIEVLLENGADATKKNKFGFNVFLITVTCGVLSIVEKVLEHVLCGGVSRQSLQRIFSPVSLAILFGHNHIFKYLLERSFDPNAATPFTGITPLMFAAAIGNNKAMKRLLHYKADPTLKNYIGKSATEILRSRHHGGDVDPGSRKRSPHTPLIVISQANTPHLQLTPYPHPLPNDQHLRKSSNAHTPSALCSPAITPIPTIAPQMMPQMFFGPNFSPNQFVSPAPVYHTHSFLNAALTPSGAFISPMIPQAMCHQGYV